jgi:two-component system response regulator HydG
LFGSHRSQQSPGFTTFDLEENEKQLIQAALKKHGHNKSQAARLLNISRSALNRKLKKHGLQVTDSGQVSA